MTGLCECGCGQPTRIARYSDRSHGRVNGQPLRFIDGHQRARHRYSVRDNGRVDRTYQSWCAMRGRCFNPANPAWPLYGGRGITICAAWSVFETFVSDMGPRPERLSLDRIDSDKDYSPENCRWASWQTQQNNRRNNHRIEVDGVLIMTVADAARAFKISYGILNGRIHRGWPVSLALFTPVEAA